MTNLINQITINGETTTFLNYVNPVVSSVSITEANVGSALVTQLSSTNVALSQFGYWSGFNIKFPVPWENLTGQTNNGPYSGQWSNVRVQVPFRLSGSQGGAAQCTFNSSTTSAAVAAGAPGAPVSLGSPTYAFMCVNNHAVCWATFSNVGRTTLSSFSYTGWLKDGQYTGAANRRNLVNYNTFSNRAVRVNIENQASVADLIIGSPAINCSVATPGANATQIILQDALASNNYIGQFWNCIRMPSTAVAGKIYRNTGIDPDTGQIETDQTAYWMCVGTWGTDKIGMRVWTENIV